MKTKIDTCNKYWKEFVLPDLKDFIEDQGNVRKAFHSAISLLHMADWIYKEKGLAYWQSIGLQFKDRTGAMVAVHDDKSFANAIATINPDFELVRGVANSAKHFELKRRGNHAAAPISSANTYSRVAAFDSSSFDQTAFDATDEVMLEGPGGNDLLFLKLAQSSKDTLKKFSTDHNISVSDI
jgi:hypothetical protein